MSEMSRHNEATNVEELRHAKAGEDEMTLHGDNSHDDEHLLLEHKVIVAKATLAGRMLMIIIGGIVFLALGVLVYVVVDSGNSENENGDRIDALTENVSALTATVNTLTQQLAEAQDLIAENNANSKELDLCVKTFDNAVAAGSREVNVGTSELLVIISTVAPGPEREAAALNQIELNGDANKKYRDASLAREQWTAAGQPLPCPI